MSDVDDIYAAVSTCTAARCVHTTESDCVAAWRVRLTDTAPVEVTPAAIAQARAQALDDFLTTYRLPSEWVVGETEDGETITINDALRRAANTEREASS